MQDYSNLGLNSKLRKLDSLATRGKIVDNLEFEASYQVQVDRINASKVNLGEFVKRATGGTVLGTFSTSQALNLTSTITYNKPKASNRTFGIPIVGIYDGAGTAAADQIYPVRGVDTVLGRFDIIGGEMDYSNYNGTASQWRGMIVDTQGTSTQVITFAVDWLFTDYVTDNVS